ncbi:MAG TPA: VCBS repeat-containing protein [Anaerolineae bacterium]|nr:VCBS repeat-containing protein [Anaerolineae bacterium]HQH38552.1 VCBS repeat-containing protein [Anaerolineae bacterium]
MKRLQTLILVLLGLSIAMMRPVSSAFSCAWPPLPEAVADFSSSAYSLPGGVVDKSSPTLADITGDGIPEVLIGTTTCRANQQGTCTYDQTVVVTVYRGDGTQLWARDVGAPINSAPAVGDINADGQPEIVVSTGGDVYDTAHQGGVMAYNRAGDLLWHFDSQDHNKDGYQDGIFSSPTLCDVNNDSYAEIIFGGWDQRIYLLDYQGHSLWSNLPAGFPGPGYYNADSIWSTAACADLNRDGYKEIIIGADITGGGYLPDGMYTQDGGFLYIFDRSGNVLVRRYLPETIYAAPVVGDLDRDGSLEIVSGTGWYWWNAHGRTEQPYVYIFDTGKVFDNSLTYSNPAKLPFYPGWPQSTDYPGFSSPALADLDDDNDLEIVIGTGHPDLSNDSIPGAGSVYAWHHNGQQVQGWPVSPKNAQGNDAPVFSSPTIGDVDSDGSVEICFSMLWDVQVYHADGSFQDRLNTQWTIWGSPALGDTDGDGYQEIWIGGSNYFSPQSGHLWRFESNASGGSRMPWPMFHHDPQNTGHFPPLPQMNVVPTSLYVLHEYGRASAEGSNLYLRYSGDVPVTWGITSKPVDVQVIPSDGMISTSSIVSVNVVITTTSYQTGTHSLGTIVFTGTVGGGTPVLGSPASVPVTLYVGHVYHTYLPFVLRSSLSK